MGFQIADIETGNPSEPGVEDGESTEVQDQPDLSGIEDRLDAILEKLDGKPAEIDYTERLGGIDGKLDQISTTLGTMSTKVETIAGYSGDEDMATVLSNMTGVDVFQLFAILLILGVLLGMVFVNALRKV